MFNAILTVTIEAVEIDGTEVAPHNRPVITFTCEDPGHCPVRIHPDQEFVDKECKVSIDDLINLGAQLRAFRDSRKT